MPAVTAADILVLPRVPDPDPAATSSRPVVSVTDAPSGFEGEGFPVRRAFAGVDRALLDPFVHMDQMGEVEYGPREPKGTAWHPHRGFETVTYMIDGTFQHQDSTGGGGLITNGATQWMTAGAGILHIERPPETLIASGGLFHGIQLWVNLPSGQKWTPPRSQDIRATRGDAAGPRGPGVTHTPITLVPATVNPRAELRLPWRRDFNGLVYVLNGRGTVGATRAPIGTGQLAAFGAGDVVSLTADLAQESRSPNLDVLVLGGEPIGEPIAWYGPFVMNTHEELAQAFDDYRRGRMGTIPAAHIGNYSPY